MARNKQLEDDLKKSNDAIKDRKLKRGRVIFYDQVPDDCYAAIQAELLEIKLKKTGVQKSQSSAITSIIRKYIKS